MSVSVGRNDDNVSDEDFTTKQFHYTSWPDHGVPESTAATLMMLRKARQARVGNAGPMVVHCSAGVGRTGALQTLECSLGVCVCMCVCVCVCVRV
jgi:protein tyrosine phosphatase